MALRRSVVATIFAERLFASISRLQSCVTISRFRLEISVKVNVVSANSGTARMSRIKVRVKPIEPAPIMAILMATFLSPSETYSHHLQVNAIWPDTTQCAINRKVLTRERLHFYQ